MHENQIGTRKMILMMVAAIIILTAAQSLALLTDNVLFMLGCPLTISNVITGILYPVIAFAGIKLLVNGCFKQKMQQYKITAVKPRLVWCCAAVIMPCMVSVLLCGFAAGHWEFSSLKSGEMLEVIMARIFFYGIGAGITEEMVFRGVIMSALEYRWNKYIGIIVPSVLFAVLHVIGNTLSVGSFLQLLIAGSVVGILFSLVTYESGSIWSSAVMHVIWNIVILGGILHIGDTADPWSIYNYVLETKSFWITGGDFGIEASVVSILAYAVFILLALVLLRKQKEKQEMAQSRK